VQSRQQVIVKLLETVKGLHNSEFQGGGVAADDIAGCCIDLGEACSFVLRAKILNTMFCPQLHCIS
jgi:hypothetical protein